MRESGWRGYNFPASDFFGLSFNDGVFSVSLAIEPNVQSLAGYAGLALFGATEIRHCIPGGVPVEMHNNAPSFPTAPLTVLR